MTSNWWKGLNENSRRVTIGVWTAIGIALIAIGAIAARG
jgi:hypothetical protein